MLTAIQRENKAGKVLSDAQFREMAKQWNAGQCDGVTVFKKTAHHLKKYWKSLGKHLKARYIKDKRKGSSDLARRLIHGVDIRDVESLVMIPEVVVIEGLEDDAVDLQDQILDQDIPARSHASIGTGTDDYYPTVDLINLDSLAGVEVSGGNIHMDQSQISTRRVRAPKRCRTCESAMCVGLSTNPALKCPLVSSSVPVLEGVSHIPAKQPSRCSICRISGHQKRACTNCPTCFKREGGCGFSREEGRACDTSLEESVAISKKRKEEDNAYKLSNSRDNKRRKVVGEGEEQGGVGEE